jgi:proline racemase
MCGHGTIGVATVLVERALVKVTEPITTIRLDTPAGLVVVDVLVKDGKALNVTLTNVPSFLLAQQQEVEVAGFGKLKYDIAYGGNFYAIIPVERVGIEFKRDNGGKFLDLGLRICDAINQQNRPVHPENPEIAICHHVDFISPGTSARLAQMFALGEIKEDEVLINESWIGSIFEGRISAKTKVGALDAIVPTITGRAWIMGESNWTLDESDPFPEGFIV